ncbi:hypothetical protein SODALDRAFT_31948 [Sodiomyces alkalinus F11]|uniref:Histone-lysine N-methyltransferase, H3 lysine-4 specific n=1 Tax=Sodiomyces alkalinus (strain CBS 110278 / VKM F-3762 / F11) TaxID=1314773 RepID=A0A3N2Q925_SODAK|nr:hypothetical protein SODALDRAFT_31948 [Sodiomyces alkalinus F11]ROT43148.1 hypothetical protein SODALDRAFT_31948 [Sodiomyces alkalinus F11]
MGGRLGYINTDFHLPKSRLRHTPYNLRPYPYDPKTSVGPGPPTQVVVMGFNPLIAFSKVSQIFASFGDIAESSNKMHPETGSYLGFATFRYKDSLPTRSKPVPIKAMDAARRAVKSMHGQRIESYQIRVEFDPEGKKSRRMMEETLKRDRMAQQPSVSKPAAPTGPKTNALGTIAGPPPMAPKGPAAQRQFPPHAVSVAGRPPHPPKPHPPKPHSFIEEKPIAPQLVAEPYIFVPSAKVPVMHTTVPHMKRRLKAYVFDDIRVDRTGYYIVFSNSLAGKSEAERCYRSAHCTEFFNYQFYMTLCIPSHFRDNSGPPAAVRGHRTPSPEPIPRREAQMLEERDRRCRDDELDMEEEKRQRAKNFDPVKAACEVITQELAEHLIKHIRTRVAAPALTAFLNPANHTAKRRKLNLEEPAGAPSLHIEAGDESSRIGTPNSGADPIERRTGRLEVSALPRIRKAKATGQGQRNHGFTDPFGRGRAPQQRTAVRSLHHRLQAFDSDIESDDEGDDVGASVARETEEPESRPRSRMSTDDEDDGSKDDLASWGPAEDDSMTDISFAVGGLPSKKRKLNLDAQSAIKRQKKSDEELFGVTLNHIETDFPVHEITEEATPEVDMADSKELSEQPASRSETPATVTGKAAAKKPKAKRKSKKQILEERESLKKESTGPPEPEPVAIDKAAAEEPAVEDKTEGAVAIAEPVLESPDLNLFSHVPVSALELSGDFLPDMAALQDLPLSSADRPELARLRKKFGIAELEDPLLWLLRRNRIRELNSAGQSANESVGIGGYYVPNSTGCARTEGVKKILNSEKSKYLPHHIKVQKAREAREAKVKKDGKDALAPVVPQAPKGNSRANRANNRRHVTALQDEMKSSGDPDVFKFNQLKKRKKPVKFARSAIHNWGLYTEENINKDDMIIEYVGEQVRQQISEIREKRYLKQGMGSSYLFRIDDNTVIDATKKGGIARFINHSCMPNCTAKIIKVDGSKRIVIYALRDIARNEELTYDYKFEREIGSTDRIPCLCGTAQCKGFLN